MNERGFLGVGDRLIEGPADTLADSAFRYELAAAPYLLDGLSYADLAHLAMLIQVGVVSTGSGSPLLRALLELHRAGPGGIALDPARGDLYTNRDHFLRQRFGDLAGLLHSGRARREATTIAWQLACRRRLWELWGELTELGGALVDTAETHRETFMPDFTYLHHAHPTTLAHYLLGYAFPVTRDLERVRRALRLMDRSPAGSGSVNGSALPLDRRFLAELLGFSGMVEHTRDAMWAPDLAIETMSALVALMTTIDRLAEDLQIWTTEEFGFVDLDDAHSRTSVIMPQKKNPYALSYLRGEARSLSGRWSSVVASSLTPSGQPDNRIIAYQTVPESLERVVRAIRLLVDVLRRVTFNRRRMSEAAHSGYSYATDMADYLVLTTGLDDATVHRVLGRAVRDAVARGGGPIGADEVRRAAQALGIELAPFEEAELERLRSPATLVALRATVGGAGREPMDVMFTDLRKRFSEAHQAWSEHPVRDFDERFQGDIVRLLDEYSA